MAQPVSPAEPAVALQNASLRFGTRTIWDRLNLEVSPGEFVAILGPNGAGKSSLLKALLGLNQLSNGRLTIAGQPPQRGLQTIGYIPQQKAFDPDLPIRGRDLVHFGLDGHRFGLVRHNQTTWQRVNSVIREVGAERFADHPLGKLSGGEQQRLRVAQALVAQPALLLCDEPLLSLDLKQQQAISKLINDYRHRLQTAVLFVTHDINPILDMVDRVLYLVGGKWAVGTPDEVLTTKRLSQLYGTPVDVLRVRGRVIVVPAAEQHGSEGQHHLHEAHA